MIRMLITSLILLLNAACAMQSTTETSTERSEAHHKARQEPRPDHSNSPRDPTWVQPGPAPRTSSNTGAATLLQQATAARNQGNLEKAQALAERAQGLEPRSGYSYLELAHIYQSKGDQARARQMALRGINYASDDQGLKNALQAIVNH